MSYLSSILKRADEAGLNEKQLLNIYNDHDLKFIDNKDTDTQGFMYLVGDGAISIAFRGTQEIRDWLIDLDGFHMDYPYDNKLTDIRVHRGFMKAYLSVRDVIHEYIIRHQPDVISICGHSLGGALATLCAVDIQYNWPDMCILCYPTGNPKVGNQAFAYSYNKRVPNTVRTYIRSDLVPNLPPYFIEKFIGQKSVHCGKANPIGPKNIFTGIWRWIKLKRARDGRIADDLTNHDLDLYKKYA